MPEPDATQILASYLEEDPRAANRLLPIVYEELRQLAGRRMLRERGGHTLQATALVHEAYMRLIDQGELGQDGRAHFLAMAAKTMRRVLVDHARARATGKRSGGGAPTNVSLPE